MLAQMKVEPWELTVMKRRRGQTGHVLLARILAALLRAEIKVLQQMYALLSFACAGFCCGPTCSFSVLGLSAA